MRTSLEPRTVAQAGTPAPLGDKRVVFLTSPDLREQGPPATWLGQGKGLGLLAWQAGERHAQKYRERNCQPSLLIPSVNI